MAATRSQVARVFISSTFRDFGEERDLLVRKVFPALRARLRERFVELVDVDLRWGITVDQAERGEVLQICLAEIDRSRPFFVGLLGERYGWVPPAEGYPLPVLEAEPWLEPHRGGKSVTELEILHGVLNNPAMAGRALFYFRSADYARARGGDYVPVSDEDARKQADLKDQIRQSGFPVVESYADPARLAELLEADLWSALDETFPQTEVPDAFERETMRHVAYALPRRGLYLGGEEYLNTLNDALYAGKQWILISGQSGGGKSALISNWLEDLPNRNDDVVLHVHYVGASGDAANPIALARRLIEAVQRTVGSTEELPGDPDKLLEALSLWLANANAWAEMHGKRLLFVIDSLNGLTERQDLRWFPSFLPERISFVVSSLEGSVMEALQAKAPWHQIEVQPLDKDRAKDVFVAYLQRFNKVLPPSLVERTMAHPLMSNPLFLRTLAEELRLFGEHERLEERLEHCLTSLTIDDLFERVLARVEEDNGADRVRQVAVGLWASRAGLTEEEIRTWANLSPADWAYISNALGTGLLEGSGRIVFGHDYLRIAVSDRYLGGNNTLDDEGQSPEAIGQRRQAHAELARWFAQHAFRDETEEGFQVSAERAAEEVPYQWRMAEDWPALRGALLQREMFEAIYDHRTDEEFLRYFLDLEREGAAQIETDYEAAWATWAPDETLEETGNLANKLAKFLRFAGRYTEFTVKLARLALDIETKKYGEDKPEAGTRMNALASLLMDMGDYAAAEPLLHRALLIFEKAKGPDHPQTGEVLNSLAISLWFTGEYVVAEPMFRRALAIAEKALGPEHPNTATSMGNLGVLVKDMGGDVAAELLLRDALAITEKALGPDHPYTGSSLNNLGLLLEDMGDYATAEPLYRRALAISEKAQGPEHPSTGTGLNNLASLLQEMGDYAAAEPLYRRALAIAEKAQGPEHPETVTSLNNLASLLQEMGDYAAAEPLYRRALAIMEKAQGSEHPETAISLNNLASMLKDMGDCAAAEPLYRRALAIMENVQWPQSPQALEAISTLADLLSDMSNYNAAETMYDRALAFDDTVLADYGEDRARLHHQLGFVLREAHRFDEAEEQFAKAIAIYASVFGDKSIEITGTLSALGQLMAMQSRYAEAEKYLLDCLKIREAELPEDDKRLLLVRERLQSVQEQISLSHSVR